MPYVLIANLRGPRGYQGVRGADGLAGVNGVENATAVAQYISTDGQSPVKDALALKRYRKTPDAIGLFTAAVASRGFRSVYFAYCGSSTVAGNGVSASQTWVNKFHRAVQDAYPDLRGITGEPPRKRVNSPTRFDGMTGILGVNFGQSGADATDYLTSTTAAEVLALAPSVVFHMVGSNDWRNGVSPATYKANMEARLNQLDTERTTTAPILHVLIHAHERFDNVPSSRVPWAEFGKVLSDIADDRPNNVLFIDASGPFRKAGIPSSDYYGLMQSDNIHLVGAGHTMMHLLICHFLGIPGAGADYAPTPASARKTSDLFTTAGPLDGSTSDGELGGSSRAWLSSTGANGFTKASGAITAPGAVNNFNGFATPAMGVQAGIMVASLPTSGVFYLDLMRQSVETDSTPDVYRIEFSSSGTRLIKRLAGTEFVLFDGTSADDAVGASFMLRWYYGTLSMFRNGILLYSKRDSDVPAGGYVGVSRSSGLNGVSARRFFHDVLG
jgi:lysophospholipase L1-like esterase